MPKISRRSISIISYKKNVEKPKIVADCLEIYSPATFAIGATENRRLNTGIKINLPESIIGALTTAPPSTKINQCQKSQKNKNWFCTYSIHLLQKHILLERTKLLDFLLLRMETAKHSNTM